MLWNVVLEVVMRLMGTVNLFGMKVVLQRRLEPPVSSRRGCVHRIEAWPWAMNSANQPDLIKWIVIFAETLRIKS